MIAETVPKDASDVLMAKGAAALHEARRNAQRVKLDEFAPDLSAALDGIRNFLLRYVVFPSEAHGYAVTLWIAHTWVLDAFDFTPYLHVCSPVKRCGKSTLLDCLRLLTVKPWLVVRPSEAVLFRKIAQDRPTLLLDEVDTIFSAKGDDNEGTRAVLNAGFERRATVPRCAPNTHAVVDFSVFCAKAIAGIGRLPDTVADRAIPIVLARRARTHHIEKFRARQVAPLAEPLTESLRKWAENPTTIGILQDARPAVPDELRDRQADICEPLLAIADLAGGHWRELARRSLVELCTGTEAQDENAGTKLLAAFRDIFREKQTDRIATKEALEALIARDDDSPWASMWERDVASGNVRGPAARLAKLLKPFSIAATTIRLDDGNTPKGYKTAQFEEAWARYLA